MKPNLALKRLTVYLSQPSTAQFSMASTKGEKNAKCTGAADVVALGPVQHTVLIVQPEALEDDEAIRQELRIKAFTITNQGLVHLNKEEAHRFIYHVCNPLSLMHQQQQPEAQDMKEQSSNKDEAIERLSTPRERSTPRAPQGDSTDDNEALEDAVNALSSGPVLMLGLEKPNAIAELLHLVGSANADLWATEAASNCLRARFGKGKHLAGVRCSTQEITVKHEIEFLLSHSGEKHRAHGHNQHYDGSSSISASKSAQVDLDQLLNFIFPPQIQHPNSAGRLFVFALYGPLDTKARLRSGEKGLHVVTDQEVKTMSHRMEREDILAVYGMCSLSQEEEEEVIRQVDHMLKNFPQYTKRDITALFYALPRDANDQFNFHAMQAAVMKERCRRVLCMKERLHQSLAPPIQNKYKQTLTRLVKTKDEIAPASLFLKDIGFTGAENVTLVSRLLSNYSFQICQLADGNSPSLTQNVRLLREQIRLPNEHREPWNPNCLHRK